MRVDQGIAHPFATQRRFRTDGKCVLMEEAADDGERRLLDIMTDEFGFPEVIEPSLFDTVVYVDDLAAHMKFDGLPNIIVDPRLAFGRPVVEAGHVPTETLAAAFLAEGDVNAVADWYKTDAASVTQALAFEQRLAA